MKKVSCILSALSFSVAAFVLAAAYAPAVPASAASAPADRAAVTSLTGGQMYYIRCAASGKYMDVTSGAAQSGTAVQQYDFNGTASQRWRAIDEGGGYYELVPAFDTAALALDISGASGESGAAVQIYAQNGTDAQKYKISPNSDGTFTISTGSTAGAKCVGVPGGSAENSVKMQQLSPDGSAAQKFYFETASDISLSRTAADAVTAGKTYFIKSAASGLYVTLKDGSDANGAGIDQEQLTGGVSQRWKFAANSDGSCTLINMSSYYGRVIDVPACRNINYLKLQLYDSNGTQAQKFKAVKNTDGTFTLFTGSSGYTKCMDIYAGSGSPGAAVQQYEANGTAAQSFTLEQAGDTLATEPAASVTSGAQYYIQSAFSGLFVMPKDRGSDNYTTLTQTVPTGDVAQRWLFTQNSDGSFTIKNVYTGRVIDTKAANNADDADLDIFDSNGTDAQRWKLSRGSDGTYSLTSKCTDYTKGLDIEMFRTQSGSRLHSWTYRGQANQKWNLIPVSSGEAAAADAHIGLDAASAANTKLQDTLSLSGWSVNSSGVKSVSVYFDSPLSGGFIGAAQTGKASADAASQYPACPGSANGGFSFSYSGFAARGLSYGSHTVYIVSAGFDGSTSVLTKTLSYDKALELTTQGIDGSTLTHNLTFSGSLLEGGETGVSVYLNSVNSAGKLGDAVIDSANHTFTFTDDAVDVSKAASGDNTVYVVAAESDGGTRTITFRVVRADPAMKIESPESGFKQNSSTMTVSGYVLDYVAGALTADIYVDGVKMGTAQVNTARTDSDSSHQVYANIATSGFSAALSVVGLTPGAHALTIGYTAGGKTFYSAPVSFISPTVVNVNYNITCAAMLSTAQKSNASVTDADINPETIKSTQGMTQFMSLYWFDGVTAAQLDGMLTNCGVLTGKGAVFLDAAKQAGINPVYLVAHARLETGNGTSYLATGYYYNSSNKTATYTGYFDEFGICAYDDDPSNGNSYAQKMNWNSVDAAIYGGAKWIARNYIQCVANGLNYDQNTLYEMKWDPYACANGKSLNCYATDLDWASNIAGIMDEYSSIFNGKAIAYKYPVFNK